MFTLDPVTIIAYDTPSISAIEPDGGPTSGTTLVTLYGNNLVSTQSTICLFGDTTVDATGFINGPDAVVCASPVFDSAEVVPVNLALNGHNYTTDDIPFHYHDAITLNISVPRGPVTGNTPLSIQLNGTLSSLVNFGDPIIVRFLSSTIDETVSATLDDDSHIVMCASPDVTAYDAENFFPHTVQVSVSLNGGQQFTDTSVPFEFYTDISVLRADPTGVPADSEEAVPITISGTNFIDRPATVRLTFVDTSELVIPPANVTFVAATGLFVANLAVTSAIVPGAATIEVSLNGGTQYTSDGIEISFFAVLSVTPEGGPSTGGTSVTVTGQGFITSAARGCRFGTFVAQTPTFVSPTQYVCLAPPVAATPAVAVDITVDGTRYTDSSATFTYHASPLTVTALDPSAGPSTSTDGKVTLIGKSFVAYAGVAKCRFGATDTDATSVTSTSVVCPLPSGGFSVTPVSLALNGVDFATTGRTFSFYDVFSLEPVRGPASGGTTVLLSGDGFQQTNTTSWKCRFGSATVDAEVLSQAQVRCVSPTVASKGAVSVDVSHDGGATFTANTPTFAFYTDPVITAVEPASGPSVGGSTVTVHGYNLVSQGGVSVRFGDTPGSSVAVVSSSTMTCDAPAGTGSPSIEVSLNGIDFTTGSGVSFAYFSATGIAPTLSPSSGGTEVTVTGSGFERRFFNSKPDLVLCRFGSLPPVVAIQIDTVRIRCEVPVLEDSGFVDGNRTVSVAVSTNGGVDYVSDPSGTSLAIYDPPSFSSLTPLAGPDSGNTAVTIMGQGITSRYTGLACRFGSALSGSATRISGSSIVCTAPSSAGTVAVFLSFNGVDFHSTGLTFALFSALSFAPTGGPVTGGTMVEIAGAGFREDVASLADKSLYTCLFVSSSDASMGSSQAVYLSPNAIRCTTPSMPAPLKRSGLAAVATLSIRIHTDGGNTYGSPPSTFVVYDPPVVTALSPREGASSGGDPVTLYGTGFAANATTCRFGDDDLGVRVSAANVTATSMICTTTPRGNGTVPVLVSNNGQQDHSFNAIAYTFTECAAGFSASSDTQPCEPCPGGFYKADPGPGRCQPCEPNEYTNATGMVVCLECPTGSSVRGTGDALEKCLCDRGFFQPDGIAGGVCEDCPDGGVCAGLLAKPVPREGFWAADVENVFVPCDPPEACPGGDVQDCAEGYTGRLCSQCEGGSFRSGGRCHPCPEQSVWVLVAGALLIVVIAGVLYKVVGKKASAFAGTVGIATKFFQVLAIVAKLDVKWPGEVRQTADVVTSPFTLKMDALASECTIPTFTYRSQWVFTLLLPVVFAVLFAVIYGVAAGLRMLKIRSLRKVSPSSSSSSEEEGVDPESGDIPISPASLPSYLEAHAVTDRIINAYMMFLSLAYLLLVSTALELLACTSRRDGSSTLNAAPSLVCYEPWWWDLLPACILALIIYGLGIPIGISMWLYKNTEKVDDPRFAARFGSLFQQYNERHPFWEGAVMLEKAMFAGVGIMVSGFVAFQIAILVVLFVSTMVIYDRVRPYELGRDNEMQHRLRWCSLSVLCAGMIFATNVFPGEWARRFVIVLACTAIIVGTVVIVLHVVLQLRDQWHESAVEIPKPLLKKFERVFNPRGQRAIPSFVRSDQDRAPDRIEKLEVIVDSILFRIENEDTEKQRSEIEIKVMRTFSSNVWLAEVLPTVTGWFYDEPAGEAQRVFFSLFAELTVWSSAELPWPIGEGMGESASSSDGKNNVMSDLYGPRMATAASGLPLAWKPWRSRVHAFFAERHAWKLAKSNIQTTTSVVPCDGSVGSAEDDGGVGFAPPPLVHTDEGAWQELEALRKALEEKDKELEAVVKEKDAVIKEKDAVIKEKDVLIKEKDTGIAEREAEIARLKGITPDKDKPGIASLEARIKEKDEVIAVREAVIKEMDAVIQESDKARTAREAEVEESRAMIKKKDAEIASKEASMKEMDNEIHHLRGLLAEREVEMERFRLAEAERLREEHKVKEKMAASTTRLDYGNLPPPPPLPKSRKPEAETKKSAASQQDSNDFPPPPPLPKSRKSVPGLPTSRRAHSKK